MAFYDWNGDGKKDLVDDFIEYNIYMDYMHSKDDSTDSNNYYYRKNRSDNASKTTFWHFFIVMIICSIIGTFNELIAAIILIICSIYIYNN